MTSCGSDDGDDRDDDDRDGDDDCGCLRVEVINRARDNVVSAFRLNDDQRRALAVKGKALGRKTLSELTTIVTPDMILR